LQHGEGAPELTLTQQLLHEFEVLDANKSDLNRQKERVVSHSIGMKSKLPQVIRREEKKRKIEDPLKPDLINKKLIEEEGKSDLDLFKEIDSLTSCCSRSDGSTNCIKKHFSVHTAGSSSLRFDFTALCSFVRRFLYEVYCYFVTRLSSIVNKDLSIYPSIIYCVIFSFPSTYLSSTKSSLCY
jgi:hypothetical protein